MAMALPIVGILATVASSAVGVVGAIQQGNAQASAANYNAAVANNNAIAAGYQRDLQLQQMARERDIVADQGANEADRIRQRNRVMLAEQANGVMGSGVTLSGSGMDMMAQSAMQGALTVMDSEYKTELEIYQNKNREQSMLFNSNVEINNMLAQAELHRLEAKNAKRSAMFNAIGAGIGGVASVAGSMPSFGPSASVKASAPFAAGWSRDSTYGWVPKAGRA